MRKTILSITLFFLGTLVGLAQSLSLSHNGNSVNNGDTVKVYEDTTGTIYAHVDVTNTSDGALDVLVKKVELSLVQGSENYFCWGACYTPMTYVSPSALTIQPQATSTQFDGEYNPKGNLGTSRIMYVFFVDGNADDSAAVVVEYEASGVGIEDETQKPEFSNAYPNPANDKVSFHYDLPPGSENASLILRNMIGAKVKEVNLSANTEEITLLTRDLNEGMYFYSLILDNNIYVTKKLVIKH